MIWNSIAFFALVDDAVSFRVFFYVSVIHSMHDVASFCLLMRIMVYLYLLFYHAFSYFLISD